MRLDDAPCFGRYRAREVIAAGAMGVVYRAEHLDTGARVAVKRVARVAASEVAALRREIHALGRVHHRGVVRLLDQGVVDGVPWYAMELLDGQTLRGLLLRHRVSDDPAPARDTTVAATGTGTDGPHPAATASGAAATATGTAAALHLLPLVAALCEPLAVVHAAGLVHRDLKPDNVVVIEDAGVARPVLVDFGIATGFGGESGHEPLDAAGQARGTLAYMAPEQIRGELLDARADLYALGCVLYECVVGRPPFDGGSARELRQQHLAATPVLPSRLGIGVQPALEHLIVRLLAKRPADRPGTAGAVALALHELGHGTRRAAPAVASARGESYLYRAPLVGREASLERARGRLDALARSRTGGTIAVVGAAGVGRTRFGLELLQHAARQQVTVVAGECRPPTAEPALPLAPLTPLVRAVIDRCLEGGDEVTRRWFGGRGRVLLPYFPELATLAAIAAEPEPIALKPDTAKARVLDVLAVAVRGFATEAPCALFVDDAQWADELTLELLARLARGPHAATALVCIVAYRSEDASALLDRLVDAGDPASAVRLELHRLDDDGVHAMVAGMLAVADVPRAWVQALTAVSAGNPYFLTEHVRAAIDAGLLVRDGGGRWSFAETRGASRALPLPTTIGALLERRLDGLGAAERSVLGVAAVLGRHVDGEVAAAVAGLDDAAALDAVSGLVRRQIVEEAGQGLLRFVHDRLREVAYDRLTGDERRSIHARAAQQLERRAAAEPAAHGALAHHHAGAGHHAAAAQYFTSAARHAETTHAVAQAIEFYRGALAASAELPATASTRLELWTRVGELLHRSGHAAASHAAYGEALALIDDAATAGPGSTPGARAVPATVRAAVLRRRGKTWETRQDHAAALADYAAAEAALGDAPTDADDAAAAWWHEWVQLQIERIFIHYWAADQASLRVVVARLASEIDARGSDGQRARFFISLVQRDLRAQRYRVTAQTAGYMRSSLAAFERTGDAEEIADARFSLGFVLLASDEPVAAVAPMRAALAEAERLGNAGLRARCLAYLAVSHRRQGDVVAAAALAAQGHEAARAAGMTEYLGTAEANLGWAALCDGALDTAATRCHAALAHWQTLPLTFPFQWLARLPLLAIALRRGAPDDAHAHARALVEPSQQELPDPMREALAMAPRGGIAMLERTLLVAEQQGFL